MTRLEKCELLKEKGYTYNFETGKVYGLYGKQINNKSKNGYIVISGSSHMKGNLYAHHFAWYMTYGNVDFDELDHINRDKEDNKIFNLRIVNRSQNLQNRNSKGYIFRNSNKKYQSYIKDNKKFIHLGYFNTAEDANKAYLNAKKIYHTENKN